MAPIQNKGALSMKFLLLATVVVAVSIGGCGGGADEQKIADERKIASELKIPDEQQITMFKKTGTVQCSVTKTTKVALDAEVSALRSAGIDVLASACASDGVAHPSQCGMEAGDLFAVVVTSSNEANALKMGFQSAGAYSSATAQSCQ